MDSKTHPVAPQSKLPEVMAQLDSKITHMMKAISSALVKDERGGGGGDGWKESAGGVNEAVPGDSSAPAEIVRAKAKIENLIPDFRCSSLLNTFSNSKTFPTLKGKRNEGSLAHLCRLYRARFPPPLAHIARKIGAAASRVPSDPRAGTRCVYLTFSGYDIKLLLLVVHTDVISS